ncbi:MAG: hypothetical protein ACE145_18375 [Terriglobia bacterium]
MKTPLIAILTFLSITVTASGDTLILWNGTRYEGTVITASGMSGVTLKDQTGARHQFALKDIRSIEFTAPANVTGRAATPAIAATVVRTVPNGTEISVRTNEEISSKTAAVDQKFSALVEQDVLDASGNVAIPKASDVALVIRKATGGSMTTTSDLVLDIESLTVAGTRYDVSTADVEQEGRQGLGANKRTAEMVGGGAAIGALIGAIAGKGKGAAIGAAVGAAGGAGAQVLTKGKEVSVPAETILKFKIDKDLVLNATK